MYENALTVWRRLYAFPWLVDGVRVRVRVRVRVVGRRRLLRPGRRLRARRRPG